MRSVQRANTSRVQPGARRERAELSRHALSSSSAQRIAAAARASHVSSRRRATPKCFKLPRKTSWTQSRGRMSCRHYVATARHSRASDADGRTAWHGGEDERVLLRILGGGGRRLFERRRDLLSSKLQVKAAQRGTRSSWC